MKTQVKNLFLLPALIARSRLALQFKKGVALELTTVSLVTSWAAGWPLQAKAQVPVDVIGTLPVADYNTFIAPYATGNWGFEPFIAVNPVDPNKIVISSQAYFTDSLL